MRGLREKLRRDRGIALPIVAMSFVAIMAFTALAVDFGWLMLQRSSTQAAADAAALAGVTALPGFPDLALDEARRVAGSNGYQDGVDGAVVEIRALAAQKMEASVSKPVDTFFLRVLGFNQMTIKRTAIAEYATQLPMGSPESYLGGPDGGAKPLYLAINGPGSKYQGGDPQSTLCAPRSLDIMVPSDPLDDLWGVNCPNLDGTPPTDPLATNPDYDPNGYYMAVEVGPHPTHLKVDLFDPWGFDRGFSESPDIQPYDLNGTNFNTRFRLYEVDDTPFNPEDNSVVLCDVTYSAGADPTLPAIWDTFCDIPAARAGLYPIQVQSVATSFDANGKPGSGVNLYALRAFTSGTPNTPKIFGLGELSVAAYQNNSVNPEFFLAEVAEFHGGRTLQIELFDSGDADGSVNIEILRPDGNLAGSCSWSTRRQALSGSETSGCSIDAKGAGQAGSSGSQGRFNEDWLDIRIPIPQNYACEPTVNGCWWKIRIAADSPRDRTTWHAKVTGVPIHLVFEPSGAPTP